MATALIIGASGTLGSAIGRELIARRFSVGLHWHTRKEACEKLCAEACADGLQAACYQAGFDSAQAPQALATSFLKDFSRLDALVWAAGIARDAPLATLSDTELRAQIQVDLRAFFLTLKAFARQFMKQKSGAVVALSSHAGLAGRAGGTAYAMAQSGLLALVKSAAREWGPLGVRVNAVLPPFIAGSGMGGAASPEFSANVQARQVIKQPGEASAVATFVAELLNNQAISGQVLCVDDRIKY
jgi:3-oxoacyl-[acyl-carrier protein] reductase